MDYRVLLYLARVNPLTAWSIVGSLTGIDVAVWQAGYAGMDRPPHLLAAGCAILLQYVAHTLNDLMDRDPDAATKSPETGTLRLKKLTLSTAYSAAPLLVRPGVSAHV